MDRDHDMDHLIDPLSDKARAKFLKGRTVGSSSLPQFNKFFEKNPDLEEQAIITDCYHQMTRYYMARDRRVVEQENWD